MKKDIFYEIGIVLVSLAVTFLLANSYPGKIIDLKLYDMYSMIKPRPKEWNKIAYVNIDDQSKDIVGRWPWPRETLAQGLDIMKEFGVGKVLFDIEFIESSLDTLNYDYYYNSILGGKDKNQKFASIQGKLITKPDFIFASSIADSKNVYLACRGVEDTKKERLISGDPDEFVVDAVFNKHFIAFTNETLKKFLPVDQFMEIPAKPLYIGAKGVGFTTAEKGIDGAVRKIPLFRIYSNYLVPQLVLPIILDELKVKRDQIDVIPGDRIRFVTADGKTINIPITRHGEMFITWSKRWKENPFSLKGGIYVPFSALLEYPKMKELLQQTYSDLKRGDLLPEEKQILIENAKAYKEEIKSLAEKFELLKDKIVIIGDTSTSSSDIGSITIDPTAPMALMQGNILNTIYYGLFLREIPGFANILITVLIMLLIFLVSINVNSATRETLISAIIIPVVLVGLYVALAGFGVILNYFMILFGTILTLVAITVFKFILFDKQKNFIKRAFMQYLSPEVVQQVIANPALLKLGGAKREITAFFSDVQGFTTISEKLTPEEVVKLLNKYLTAMTDLILKYGGTVDKYEGDAIVAFFGAPIPHPDHAVRCCNAAVDMQKDLNQLRRQWVDEGYPEVIARIGINTGEAIVGNMGSEQRMDYTMMGNTVNTAARFEGANKKYGTFTMISEATYEYIRDKFVVRKLDMLRVVGKSKPDTVYELVGRIGEVPEEKISIINQYHEALEVYNQWEWRRARDMFKVLADKFQDGPSMMYQERCSDFMETPPPEDWDGVFVLKTK